MNGIGERRITVIGGAGFVGANLSAELIRRGGRVRVFDNLSRAGVRRNAGWLRQQPDGALEIEEGDVRDDAAVRAATRDADLIFQLAGQVAVTTSVADPRLDFEINALGTLNVLEGARLSGRQPVVVFSSTNKVYGGMEDLRIAESAGRYTYADLPEGVDEGRPLDFHSPYGCSKGAADQYVRDYARIYGFPTVVFRMSCIYGPRQYGNEDQGWVAHFARAALRGEALRIYGDGRQVRDVLYVGDLVEAFCRASENPRVTGGQVYNIGGGPENTLSLRELVAELEGLVGRRIDVSYHDWRPGDQRVYVSNPAKAARDFGWRPRVSPRDGLRRLLDWLRTEAAA